MYESEQKNVRKRATSPLPTGRQAPSPSPPFVKLRREGAALLIFNGFYIYHIKFSFLISIFEVFRYC